MAIICPTVTAYNPHTFRDQMERIAPFSKRVHVDLMDGQFAPTKSPGLDQVWWPHELQADIHLMYQDPEPQLAALIKLKPSLVVIHNEVQVHHMHFAAQLHKHDIDVGLALLPETPVEWAHQIMHSFDHVLVFSGDLGHHGGHADLGLLDKVKYLRSHHPEVEISWDGGINADNARQLVDAGVDVLNVGGFIQNADDPKAAYQQLLQAVS